MAVYHGDGPILCGKVGGQKFLSSIPVSDRRQSGRRSGFPVTPLQCRRGRSRYHPRCFPSPGRNGTAQCASSALRPMASRAAEGSGWPDLQAEPEEKQIPRRSRSRTRDSPRMPGRVRLRVLGRRLRGRPVAPAPRDQLPDARPPAGRAARDPRHLAADAVGAAPVRRPCRSRRCRRRFRCRPAGRVPGRRRGSAASAPPPCAR